MTPPSGGKAVVDALVTSGIDTAFGIPGTHNLEIYRYLPGSGIRHVSMRHEQGVGYAADGYARVLGRPAVCLPTSGPGLANLVTAAATAYADSVPMVIVTPGPPVGAVGGDLGRLHEMRDQFRMMSGVVEWAFRPERPTDVGPAITEAVQLMLSSRPRPAFVEIPLDILEGPWDQDLAPPEAPGMPHGAAPDLGLVAEAADALNRSGRTVIVLGGGARRAARTCAQIAERLDAAVLTTVNGKGIVDERDDRSLGASLRLPAARKQVRGADTVLMIGTEWSDADLWGGVEVPEGTLIRVDIDPAQLTKNADPDIGILGDAEDVLQLLLPALEQRPPLNDWMSERELIFTEAMQDGAVWRQYQEALRDAVPDDLVVCGDSAQVSYFGTVHLLPMAPADRFLYPTGFATLGYGLPAAIGAKLAAPEKNVVVLVGDGGFTFSVQELMSAAALSLPIPIVVCDNGGFGQIRDEMHARGISPVGVDLPMPNLAALSHAFALDFEFVGDRDELASAVRRALKGSRPTLIDAPLAAFAS